MDLIPGLGRSPGGGHGNPLLYSCLENSMDRAAWWATVHGVTKESDTTEQRIDVREISDVQSSLSIALQSGFCLLSYLPTLFLAPLPLALYVPVPQASLGFLRHPKADFDSGLLHLLPLPGIFFLLQGLVYTSSARPSLPI